MFTSTPPICTGRALELSRKDSNIRYLRHLGNSDIAQFGELDEVALAYAVSIHKSQGSEYPAVVIPMMMQHYMMLRRNLLYTGITRGRKLVVLVGQKQAVGMAVKRTVETRRWSKLAEWMARSS